MNAVQQVLSEYVAWGGVRITRAEAYADAKAAGFTDREADILAFGRAAVPAPPDPDAEREFLRVINECRRGSGSAEDRRAAGPTLA